MDDLLTLAQTLAQHPTRPITHPIKNRVAYVVSHGQSYASNGYAIRTQGIAKALNQHGLETLCFVRPNRPWELDPTANIAPEVKVEGVRYIHSRWPSSQTPNSEQAHLQASVDTLVALFRVFRPAAVLAASNWQVGLPAWIAAKRLGLPFYNEVRGFWELSRAAREPSYANSNAYHQAAERDAFVAKQASKVFTLNSPMQIELVKRGVKADNIALVPNGVNHLPEAQPADPALKKRLGIQKGEKVVGYVGSFSAYEGLDVLLEACAQLVQKGEKLKLLLVGDDQPLTLPSKIEASTANIANTSLMETPPWLIQVGRIPHEQVADYYALLDAVVIPRKPLALCHLVPPMKAAEALAYGKRLVVSDVAPLVEYAEKHNGVMTFEAGKEGSLGQELKTLFTNFFDSLIDKKTSITKGCFFKIESELKNNSNYELYINCTASTDNSRGVVAKFNFFDENNNLISEPYPSMNTSDKYGSYIYIHTATLKNSEIKKYKFKPPDGAEKVSITFYPFNVSECNIHEGLKIKPERISTGLLLDISQLIYSLTDNHYKKNLISNKREPIQKKERLSELNKQINVTDSVQWNTISVDPGKTISILGSVDIKNGGSKSGVVLIRFIDKQGAPIHPDQVLLPRSDAFGTNFVYLKDSHKKKQEIFNTKVPLNATALEVSFRLFNASKETSIKVKNIEFNEAKNRIIRGVDKTRKTPKEFKVAIIADEFTTNSFSTEFISIPIEPENWQEVFEEHKPDIFFCESAWSGSDSQRRPWRGQIYASENFGYENRTNLLKILEHCRNNGIPSIFWNKEDPTHYTDRINDFVKTAKEFDFVFTSAAECIDGYKRQYGVQNVFSLPFATNPVLFNPIETRPRSSNIVFAGSWYGNHSERSNVMEEILDNLQYQGFTLEIYDRHYKSPDPIRKWPNRFLPLLNPNKPHSQMPEVYKSSIFGLNFNTVTNSSTMFARRVFELMSSNTLVISNYSRGMSEMFDDLVVFSDREPERLISLSNDQIDKLREKALTKVLREHTYKKRWHQILTAIGMPFSAEDESVTIASIIHGREEAMLSISWFQQHGQQLPDTKLLLIIGAEVKDLDAANIYQEFNRFGVSVTSMSHAIKYALKELYHPIETPYFALIDPMNPPSSDWLQRAHLHLQYMKDLVISPAVDDKLRYQISTLQPGLPILGSAKLFSNHLPPISGSRQTYYV